MGVLNKLVYSIVIALAFYLLPISVLGQSTLHTSLDASLSDLASDYIDSDTTLSITSALRYQWIGLEGAPETQRVKIKLPIQKFGIGLSFEREKLGLQSIVNFGVIGSATIYNSHDLYLGTAITANSKFFSIDGDQLTTPSGDYISSLNHNDDILPISKLSSSNFGIDISLNLSFKGYDFYVKALNLNNPEFELLNGGKYLLESNAYFLLQKSYLVSKNMLLLPHGTIYFGLTAFQYKFGATADYKNKFQAGISFRGLSKASIDALIISAGVNLSDFKIAYSYDYGLSSLQTVHTGSHEIGVTYRVKWNPIKHKMPKGYYNPRY